MARTQYPFEGRFAPRLRLVVEVRIGVITKRAIELSLRPPDAEVLTQAPAIRRTLSAKIVSAINIDGCCAIAQPVMSQFQKPYFSRTVMALLNAGFSSPRVLTSR